MAVNSRRKDGESGQWVDKPNYFDVTVFGSQGENCGQYLAKGRPVAVEGRLNWREWEAQDGGKRQAVDIIADAVQFLGSRDAPHVERRRAVESDVPADTSDFQRGRRRQRRGRRHPVLAARISGPAVAGCPIDKRGR